MQKGAVTADHNHQVAAIAEGMQVESVRGADEPRGHRLEMDLEPAPLQVLREPVDGGRDPWLVVLFADDACRVKQGHEAPLAGTNEAER